MYIFFHFLKEGKKGEEISTFFDFMSLISSFPTFCKLYVFQQLVDAVFYGFLEMLVKLIRKGIVLMIQAIIYKIFGIWLWHRVLRTSWARIFWDQRRGGIDRIGGGVLLYGINTLDFSLFSLVDVLLVVSNNTLGEGLSDGIDLGDVSSSSDSNSDVEVLEFLKSEE